MSSGDRALDGVEPGQNDGDISDSQEIDFVTLGMFIIGKISQPVLFLFFLAAYSAVLL